VGKLLIVDRFSAVHENISSLIGPKPDFTGSIFFYDTIQASQKHGGNCKVGIASGIRRSEFEANIFTLSYIFRNSNSSTSVTTGEKAIDWCFKSWHKSAVRIGAGVRECK